MDKRRTVFIGINGRKLLRKYMKEREKKYGHIYLSERLVTTDDNNPLTYDGLFSILRFRAQDAGIPTIPPHDFRRAFAVEMLRNGCDLVRLADLMGHNSLEILKLYLHLVEDDIRQAHSSFGPVDHVDL